ncbi:Fic family protein [Candidatus Peregrinibacteria bacterium]|nr:Fic family protein [Candidatus Peregrinibacteria bacterium]MBI3816387.1 Fic family protein [Candidatus Peregrinibacteria bacterium]
MAKKNHRSRSRYNSGGSENEYMDTAQRVLKNKKGISDLRILQIEEEKSLVKAYETVLTTVSSNASITSELIRYAHKEIFGELYDWAGRWRTVTISKPGITWPPPDFLEEAMQEFERTVLMRYPASALVSDEAFCSGIGHIQGEFLAIHPFREGNARTIKLVTNLLAVQTKRSLLRYDTSEKGRREYIHTAQTAILQNFLPMARIVQNALRASRKDS